jgi:hypothetical protein
MMTMHVGWFLASAWVQRASLSAEIAICVLRSAVRRRALQTGGSTAGSTTKGIQRGASAATGWPRVSSRFNDAASSRIAQRRSTEAARYCYQTAIC